MSFNTYDRRAVRHCRHVPRPERAGAGRPARPGLAVLGAAALALAVLVGGCSNSPYRKKDANSNTLYNSMGDAPQVLDPAQTYGSGSSILMDIVETPLQYSYLNRPYKLEPLLATSVPKREYKRVEYDGNMYLCPVYTIHIKKGIKYQNSPCFVKAYRHLTPEQLSHISSIHDFKKFDTRELTADDFIYGVRRLCDQRISFPQFGTFADHMLGFNDYSNDLNDRLEAVRKKRAAAVGPLYNQEMNEETDPIYLDYDKGADKYPFVRKLGRYTFQVVETGKKIDPNSPKLGYKQEEEEVGGYPQILYWMTFCFFSPVPKEAIEFFSQPGLVAKGITFDKNPIGTGPYVLDTYDPTSQVVLKKNPNFRVDRYPYLAKPDPNDAAAVKNYKLMKDNGLLVDCGKRLPFIDNIVYRLEREAIPRWNKFMQGYYDTSGLQSEQFDETVSLSSQGSLNITDSMRKSGIRLLQTTTASLSYLKFNMEDPVVGGYTAEKQKLRQAISIAINTRDALNIFSNGMGIVAQGPVPPGVFGYVPGKAGVNPYVFKWDETIQRPVRRSIAYARKLMAEAGYPGGYDANGVPLAINYLTYRVSPQARGSQQLLKKQLQRIGIEIQVHQLAGSEFWKKMDSGGYQMAPQGWAADYPDPETFFILFHKPEKQSKDAQQAPQYYNARFEKLYSKMVSMDNTPERLKIIKEMDAILYKDAPVVFQSHAVNVTLIHDWLHNYFPYPLTKGMDKFSRLDIAARTAYRKKHNQPNYLPLAILLAALLAVITPALLITRRHLREK